MIYTAVWMGLRVSERFCRGDWSQPKTDASAAMIGVSPEVIARLHRLKSLTVKFRAGLATREHTLVKSASLDDLVFQGERDGKPMHDQNALKRHIQPAARKLGLHITWRCLRHTQPGWFRRERIPRTCRARCATHGSLPQRTSTLSLFLSRSARLSRSSRSSRVTLVSQNLASISAENWGVSVATC
jgi:hypothetical protein